MQLDKCPICGTSGKIWDTNPDVFTCPQCSSFFSRYGIILDPEKDLPDIWS